MQKFLGTTCIFCIYHATPHPCYLCYRALFVLCKIRQLSPNVIYVICVIARNNTNNPFLQAFFFALFFGLVQVVWLDWGCTILILFIATYGVVLVLVELWLVVSIWKVPSVLYAEM